MLLFKDCNDQQLTTDSIVSMVFCAATCALQMKEFQVVYIKVCNERISFVSHTQQISGSICRPVLPEVRVRDYSQSGVMRLPRSIPAFTG